VEIRDLRNEGVESNKEDKCLLEELRKVVRSVYACGAPDWISFRIWVNCLRRRRVSSEKEKAVFYRISISV
jgi:hypothetical protein